MQLSDYARTNAGPPRSRPEPIGCLPIAWHDGLFRKGRAHEPHLDTLRPARHRVAEEATYRMVEEPMPDPGWDQALTRTIYVSLDLDQWLNQRHGTTCREAVLATPAR